MRISVAVAARSAAITLAATLALGACGGSDESGDGSSPEDVGDEILNDALGGGSSDGDSSDGDSSDGDSSDGDSSDGDSSDGATEDGDFGDREGEGGDLFGIATLVVQGVTYEWRAPQCQPAVTDRFGDFTDFAAIGEGTVDGTDLNGKVIRLNQDLDGDGEAEVFYTFSIEVGSEGSFQAPAGQPSLLLQFSENDDPEAAASIEYEPGRLSGSGVLQDRNGVLAGANEDIPFTFVATCE